MSESDDRTQSGEAPAKIEMDSIPAVKEISAWEHERNLRNLRCVVSHGFPVTLHHCKGASMKSVHGGSPGISQKVNPFFQIPLIAKYHVGDLGIDTGMGEIKSKEQWEERFGTQLDHLHDVNALVYYDIWIQAGMWMAKHGRS